MMKVCAYVIVPIILIIVLVHFSTKLDPEIWTQGHEVLGNVIQQTGGSMNVIMWSLFGVCLAFVMATTVYIIAALAYAKSDVNIFYKNLPVNRFAFRTRGGIPIGIMYNSSNVKLVANPDTTKYPFGQFVSMNDPRPEIQQLGPVEKMLGIRCIGIPFVHGLLEKKLSWITVEGKTFTEHPEEKISTFAITKTFGFILKGLALGRNSDGNPKVKTDGDDQKFERILVNIKFMLQGFIENPYRAIVETSWMAGVEAKLTSFSQPILGRTSQDELIARKVPAGGKYCELVQAIIDNMAELETFGVKFEEEKITYVDYDLAGEPDEIKKIQAANTERFEKKQKAAGIRETKSAEQEGARVQQQLFLETVTKLLKKGFNQETAERMARDFLKTIYITQTGLSAYAEGGSGGKMVMATTPERKRK